MARKLLQGNRLVDDGTDPRGRSKKAVTRDGKDFKASARRIALFQSANGFWKEPDEWPGHRTKLVCRNPQCRVNGEEVDALVGENVDGVFRAACGPCGSDIEEMWVEEGDQPLPLEPPAGYSIPAANITGNIHLGLPGRK